MSKITEWEFTADNASQINEILRDRPELPFSGARCEERKKGSQKRRDLTIYDRKSEVVLTGEVKLPDKPDGRSPFQESLVIDAHRKANDIGVKHFFTWNVNKCVLWKTFEQGKPITERYIEFFDALPAPIRDSDKILDPRVKDQIKRFLVHFLERCAAIFSGVEPMKLLPLDAKFIYIWEAALDPLVTETLAAIHARYDSHRPFHASLDKWMRDEQGWTLSNEEEILRDNLERAAKFSCYVLANKIVFYKALRLRFPKMKALRIPANVETGSALKKLLDGYFEHAMKVSHDYETVFQGDFGDALPFLNDVAVDSWRALSTDTDKFDFTKINYEVMGLIFERLLSTTERHKFGQHYTRSEVVDLINAFCIRRPEATVLDPACGGGTFLVRAYERKSDLASHKLSHEQLIQQLYGLDISAYPVHLTTINLATRNLIEHANYPLVARKDFFRIGAGDKVFRIPLGNGEETTEMVMPKVDAIVGNPPYVRQEKINEYYGKAYKKLLQDLADEDAPGAELSGRSDILCYFFTHGFAFLEDGGHMGLLTSSGWLDTAYGFRLQKFLLDNFEIIAIFESNCEPWFIGARVTTAATILRRQPDAEKRNANNVKFVWLKKPVADFLTYTRTEEDRRQTFDEVRRRVENLTMEEETDVWRVRVVNQGDLYEAGCLPFEVSDDEEDEQDEASDISSSRFVQAALPEYQKNKIGAYTGYKWGIFLRAPEIFSKLIHRSGDRFIPLGQIAEIRRGITTGCDDFFYPVDVTDEALKIKDEEDFIEHYGIRRSDTKKIRIVHAGDGSQHLIEEKYLKPVIHSLMKLDSVEIDPEKYEGRILLVSEPKEKLKNTHVVKYIRWGEREEFHLGSTCVSRSKSRPWYDLAPNRPGAIFWPLAHQYRHIIPVNDVRIIPNKRLFDIYPHKTVDTLTLGAVLNSTVVALTKTFFGRFVGREGNLDTEVSDARMMLVPDPRQAMPSVRKRLESALDSMRNRKALPLVDVDSSETRWTGELALEDRQQLDDAVLELLGIADARERVALRDELYAEITKLYRQIRVAERKMQRHRSATARGGRPTPHSIAQEIWDELDSPPSYKTPLDFIPPRVRTEELHLPAGHAKIIKSDLFHSDGVIIGTVFLELGDPMRSQFVKELAEHDITGSVHVPIDTATCQKALTDYYADINRITEEFNSLAAAYTADETLQNRVVQELWKKVKR